MHRNHRILGAVVGLASSGCLSAPSGDTGALTYFHEGTPIITDLSSDCENEDALWTFVVQTDAWTGGGKLWMGDDESTVEAHKIYSAKAASDGSSDKLKLELEIVADWRDATNGSSTGWQCDESEELSYLLVVYESTGNEVTDCRYWGSQTDLWEAESLENVPTCDTLFEEEPSGDTGSD